MPKAPGIPSAPQSPAEEPPKHPLEQELEDSAQKVKEAKGQEKIDARKRQLDLQEAQKFGWDLEKARGAYARETNEKEKEKIGKAVELLLIARAKEKTTPLEKKSEDWSIPTIEMPDQYLKELEQETGRSSAQRPSHRERGAPLADTPARTACRYSTGPHDRRR